MSGKAAEAGEIRIGRFKQPEIVYLVKAGEHYLFDKEQKEIQVSDNGLLERVIGTAVKKAEHDMFVVQSGAFYLSKPTGYKEGEYSISKKEA